MKITAPPVPRRAGRGVVFTGTALALALGAHLAGGGTLPGVAALIGLAIPVAWISFFLTRARRGWPAVVMALLAVEVGLHEGLSVLSRPLNQVAPLQLVGGGEMAMGTHVATAIAVPATGGMTMPLVPSLPMVAAHLVATVLTGAALAYGEHLLWCLWTWLHHAITVLPDLVQFPAPRTVALAWLLTVSPVPVLVDRSVRRRGPPRLGTGLPTSA